MTRALLVLLALLAATPPARAEVFATTFRSTAWGVEMTLPRGWELSDQTSYPGILARGFEQKGGARLTLAARRLPAGEGPKSYVERNELSLAKLGYHLVAASTHPGGALLLEVATPDRSKVIRQAYLARGDTIYILSLAVAASLASTYVRPFDETLRGLVFTIPLPEPAAAEAEEPSP